MEKALLDLFIGKTTKENIPDGYDEVAAYFDEVMITNLKKQSHCEAAKAALSYSPGIPSNMHVLDIGAGTGLVGKETAGTNLTNLTGMVFTSQGTFFWGELKSKGFENMDGIEPSKLCLEVAATKGLYKKLMCQKFTRTPLDIPENTYDMIVTCGTFLKGHLPYDCIIEMIRLVKPGGRICIVSRSSSFDGKTVPEYKELVPLMQELEAKGKWKKLKWECLPNYTGYVQGLVIVYEVL